MLEETRPLQYPTSPCPHCGSKEFIIWGKPDDTNNQAISCDGCGAVISSTHPLDSDNRPIRRPKTPPSPRRRRNDYKSLPRSHGPLPPDVAFRDILHENGCRVFQGGCCDCAPVVDLPTAPPPQRN